MLSISKKLREFVGKNLYNSIEFWNFPSQEKWFLHNIVDKETKKFELLPILLCKSS